MWEGSCGAVWWVVHRGLRRCRHTQTETAKADWGSAGWGRAARLSCLATMGWEQQALNRSKLPGRWGRLTGAVQFHRRQTELLGDVGIFDGEGFLHLKCLCGGKYSFSELEIGEGGQNTPQDRLSEETPAT